MRRVAYGYRVGEIFLEPLLRIKADLRITVYHNCVAPRRSLVAVDLGCSILGCCPPTPDISSAANVVAGACKRFGGRTPTARPSILRALRSFVRLWLKANVRRLVDGDIPSLEEWLVHTHYNGARKDELRRALRDHPRLCSRDLECDSFLKLESYLGGWKYPRCINSRSDACKAHFGPLIAAVEHELFPLPWFVKYVPVADRARYIYDRCYRPGGKYIATDYTSFEAHFLPEVAYSIEWQLYSHVLGRTALGREELPWISRALRGVNKCRFRGVRVEVPGVRMSGDMWTSLGNGFSNLMLMLFICARKGADCVGVVEGDDGLFRIDGPIPTVAEFEELGWTIKLEEGTVLGNMGFCKQYFHSDVLENVVSPIELLLKTGWSHSRLRMGGKRVRDALLRAKADSIVAQYPNAPVARSLAEYIFRCVGFNGDRAYDDGWSPGYWDVRSRWLEPYRPDPRSYHVVEEVFGVAVADQLAIEAYLDHASVLRPVDIPCVHKYVHPTWREMYDRFTAPYPSDLAGALSM